MGGRFGELLLILIVVLLLFGPNKLPDMAKAIGQALNEFKKAANPESENQKSNQSSMAVTSRRGRGGRRTSTTRRRTKASR